MISFGALLQSSRRVNAEAKLEAFWSNRVAQNGDQKAVKQFVKPLDRAMNVGHPTPVNADEFAARFGAGF